MLTGEILQLPALRFFLSSEYPATQLSPQLQRHLFFVSLTVLDCSANSQLRNSTDPPLITFRHGPHRKQRFHCYSPIRGGLISILVYKENKLQEWKNVFTLHIPPWAPNTCNFVVLTSLTHPRKILLVVLQTTRRCNRKSQRLISTYVIKA
jgi:hypothetical protein